MAEMQVSMRLTLQDAASAGLERITSLLADMNKAAEPLNAQLVTFSRRLSSSASAAEKVANAVGGRLESALSGVADTLGRLDTRLAASVDSFAQLGLHAREAGTEVAAAGRSMDGATSSMTRMKTEAGSLTATLKGMAEVWAAMKIGHGLKESVRAASNMATVQAQMRSMGYGTDAVNYATQRSWRESGKFPAASATDVMQARLALMTATGQNNERLINAALPQLLRNAMAYKINFAPGSSLADIIGNMGGLAELRGMSQTPAGLIAASNQALQVAEATGGRMKISSQEVVGRQTKYGAAQLMSAQGYKAMMAMAEQLTLAGHEGGSGGGRGVSQMGTAVSMLVKTMNAGKISKQTAALLHAMDMWTGGAGMLSTSTTGTATMGSLRGALEGQRDPLQWVHDVLVPRMLAYARKNAKEYFPHGDLNNPQAELEALNKVATQTFASTGGVNVANLVAMVANPQIWARIEESLKRSNNAPTGQKAVDELNPYTRALQQFHAATNNLGNAIGTTLLPILNPIIRGLAAFVRGIGDAAHAVPGLTQMLSVLATGLTAVLAVSGFQKLFGRLSEFVGWINKLGPAAGTAAAETTAATTAMQGTWYRSLTGVLAMVGRFVGAVTVAFALYEAGENVKLFGVSINNYIRTSLVNLTGQFDRFFNWLNTASDRAAAHFFGAVSGAAKAVGANGIADWAKGRQIHFASAAATFQRNFDARQSIRNDMADWYTAPQAQPGYERPAKGAPNVEHAIAAQQRQMADSLLGQVGGVPDLSRGTSAGRSRRSLQDLAANWYGQDMRRLNREAAAEGRSTQGPIDQARQAVQRATAKDSAESILADWNRRASLLASSVNPADRALAPQAQQLGEKLANQFRLKAAQQHLAALQSDLRNREQTNAALVTGGALTQDQAQARTLSEQRAAAPALLQAAEAVRRLEAAAGQSTTAIDKTIASFQALGSGLTQMQQKISNAIEGSFQNLFSSIMRGKKTWKQMGTDFVNQLLSGINSAVSQNLAQGFVAGLMGKDTATGKALRSVGGSGEAMQKFGQFLGNMVSGNKPAGGSSGTGGNLWSAIGNLFSSNSGASAGAYTAAGQAFNNPSAFSSTATSGAAAGGFWSGIGDWLAGIGRSFAAGADYVPHDMVAQIHQGEMIVPKAGADALRSGALGGHQVNLTIHAMDSQSVLGAMDNIKRELATMLGGTSQNLNLGV